MIKSTQNATIRSILEAGGTLTSITAQHYGIMRLAARVNEINKAAGWKQIVGTWVVEGEKRVKQYRSLIVSNNPVKLQGFKAAA